MFSFFYNQYNRKDFSLSVVYCKLIEELVQWVCFSICGSFVAFVDFFNLSKIAGFK